MVLVFVNDNNTDTKKQLWLIANINIILFCQKYILKNE